METNHDVARMQQDVRRGTLFVMRLLGAALLCVAMGCQSPSSPEVATRASEMPDLAPAPESPDPVYSPFVVQMRTQSLPFSVISFKDVGMTLPQTDRVHVYETIAEGLALELASHETMSNDVGHDITMSDPSSHVACEGEHIYVDMWSAGEGGWGYSLWAGCGQDDEFAHREIDPPGDDRLAALAPLAVDIANELRTAIRTGCFTRHC